MKTPEMFEKEIFIKEQLAYRIPRQIITYLLGDDGYSYFYCPSCSGHIERDYQAYCPNCGQALDWDGINFIDEPGLFDD